MQTNRSTGAAAPRAIGALAIVGVLAIALGVSNVLGAPGASPSPSPGAPSAPPASNPPSEPPATPGSSPAVPGKTIVELDVADDHDVSVVIDDATGKVVKLGSGKAGDGMTVRWFDAEVVNIDADTIRVTWVGLPRDEEVRLSISEQDGKVVLAFEQAAPPANSDATGFDRVLVLDVNAPVSADDVKVTFAEAKA
jgi:hypothetical protein